MMCTVCKYLSTVAGTVLVLLRADGIGINYANKVKAKTTAFEKVANQQNSNSSLLNLASN